MEPDQEHGQKRFIRLDEVIRRTGLSKSRIYAMEAAGDFPKRISLGPKTTVWELGEITEWMAKRLADRGADSGARAKRTARLSEGLRQKSEALPA